MECKEVTELNAKIAELVLIETLWNVKRLIRNQARGHSMVLIETLWNVKIISKSPSAVRLSINRNIVECKDTCAIQNTMNSNTSINRNIVECKVLYNIVSLNTFPSINRNIVECKGLLVASDLAAFHVLIETLWNVKQDS